MRLPAIVPGRITRDPSIAIVKGLPRTWPSRRAASHQSTLGVYRSNGWIVDKQEVIPFLPVCSSTRHQTLHRCDSKQSILKTHKMNGRMRHVVFVTMVY